MLRLVAFLFFLLASGANAAETPVPADAGGAYKLDPSHASVVFKISHLGFSYYTGRFDALDGRLDFDAAHPENSKLEATLLANSLDTNNRELEEKLKGENFLNVIKFRTLRFVATHIERTGPNTGKVSGDFTMLGVARPLTLAVRLVGGGAMPFTNTQVLGFSATGSLQRSQFGFTNLLPLVGDDVTFAIEVEFDKL